MKTLRAKSGIAKDGLDRLLRDVLRYSPEQTDGTLENFLEGAKKIRI